MCRTEQSNVKNGPQNTDHFMSKLSCHSLHNVALSFSNSFCKSGKGPCASNILSDRKVCENFYTFIILYMKTSSLISLLISLKSVGSKIKTIKLVRRGALQLILCILAYNMHVLINRTVYTVMCWDFNNRICNLLIRITLVVY